MAMTGLAVASVVGMGSALLYSRAKVATAEEEGKRKLREERRRYRDRYRKTAEYQRRKELYLEKKRQREAHLQEVAYFNENDEMVLTKIDLRNGEELP